jgi:hypothetical protein
MQSFDKTTPPNALISSTIGQLTDVTRCRGRRKGIALQDGSQDNVYAGAWSYRLVRNSLLHSAVQSHNNNAVASINVNGRRRNIVHLMCAKNIQKKVVKKTNIYLSYTLSDPRLRLVHWNFDGIHKLLEKSAYLHFPLT